MFLAIYLLICGITCPVLVGVLGYKSFKKGVKKPSEKDFQSDEQ